MAEKSRTSRISGFYKLSPDERLQRVVEFAELSGDEAASVQGSRDSFGGRCASKAGGLAGVGEDVLGARWGP